MTKEGADHEKLRSLITRMHGYRNKLDENHESMELEKGTSTQLCDAEEMVKLIQNMSKVYQGRSVTQGQTRIEQLEDISKINKGYYKEMQVHKTQRLAQRHQFVNQTLNLSCTSDEVDNYPNRATLENDSVLSCQEPTVQELEAIDNSLERFSVKSRFQLLRRTLVKWAALSYIYGIEKNNIYMAFRGNRQPY